MAPYQNICYKIADELLKMRPETHECSFTPNNTLYVDDALELLQYCNDASNADFKIQPMVWIEIYIAIASLVCTLSCLWHFVMVFEMKILWFSCNFFSLNVASITVIIVAMKLHVDLTSEMPSVTPQPEKG